MFSVTKQPIERGKQFLWIFLRCCPCETSSEPKLLVSSVKNLSACTGECSKTIIQVCTLLCFTVILFYQRHVLLDCWSKTVIALNSLATCSIILWNCVPIYIKHYLFLTVMHSLVSDIEFFWCQFWGCCTTTDSAVYESLRSTLDRIDERQYGPHSMLGT